MDIPTTEDRGNIHLRLRTGGGESSNRIDPGTQKHSEVDGSGAGWASNDAWRQQQCCAELHHAQFGAEEKTRSLFLPPSTRRNCRGVNQFCTHSQPCKLRRHPHKTSLRRALQKIGGTIVVQGPQRFLLRKLGHCKVQKGEKQQCWETGKWFMEGRNKWFTPFCCVASDHRHCFSSRCQNESEKCMFLCCTEKKKKKGLCSRKRNTLSLVSE